MKPVVSSLVAFAIAIAPLAAMASTPEKSTHGKPAAAKVVKHKKDAKPKAARIDKVDKIEKIEKADGKDRGEPIEKPLARVKHTKSAGVHHAHNVQMGGGHHEPHVEKGISVVPVSLASKASPRVKLVRTSAPKPAEMPKLPDPNAQKPGAKNAAEKGARKPSEKAHESESAATDGKLGRDEEIADLVARIRGHEGGDTKADASKDKPSARKEVPCSKQPVEMIRGPEIDKFELTKCDGSIAPHAIEHLSILIRPGSAARPTAPIAELAKTKGAELAKGIRRVDPRLVERMQAVVDKFAKPGAPVKMSIISGYRPTSVGSMHSTGRAVDFRLEGVRNEDVVAFCKTLADTGCGYYPNSSFVHLDVRDPGSGHVSWIDASGPGESPRYVRSWPPPEANVDSKEETIKRPADVLEHTSAKRRDDAPAIDREAAPEPVDEHPAASEPTP